jgi:hypothetical protein
MSWRHFKISVPGFLSEEFYAPDLNTAFSLARVRWPASNLWTCHGSRL